MPGPKPQYAIELNKQEASELQQLLKSRKAGQGQVLRAKIVLLAHEHPDWSNQAIGQAAGCTDRCVRTWRRRWVESKNLNDLPRSGAPKRFSP